MSSQTVSGRTHWNDAPAAEGRAYKGISGKGTYVVNELAILAKVGGKCSMKKPPSAFQEIIKAAASVKL